MALDKITSDSIAAGAVTTTLIPDSAITSAKLHTTAISDKLGYTPVSPTQLSTAVANLVNSAPSTLDTLNELATALGNDANFATTVTTALGTKAATTYVDTRLPSGVIVMWSGSIASIPTGWVLCNGANGTPNLQDRFIVGAGSSYSVASTGGSANATLPSHTHTGGTNTTGGHTHGTTLYGKGGSNWNTDRPPAWGGDDATIPGGLKTATTSTSGDHSHVFTTDSSGVSATNANLPPYYALAYIMKS